MASWNFHCFLLLIFTFSTCSYSNTFTVTNNCTHTIWPGTLSGSGSVMLSSTGFRLDPGQSQKLTSDPKWSGRIWGRTGCKFDGTGSGKCQTGDCGGKLECEGSGATPPASLFEITLGGYGGQDFYDVSLVDGYNLPILVVPRRVYGASACNSTGCISDLNKDCPKELQIRGNGNQGGGGVVGCRSACEAFGSEQYCCSGQFNTPTTCGPSNYSTIFKKACPRAYSYAYDDKTSTFTCRAYEYQIIFCPRHKKSSSSSNKGKDQQVGSSNVLLPFVTLIFSSLSVLLSQHL